MAAKVIPFPRVACNASTPPSVLPDDRIMMARNR
jgi:hypothetical protein